MVEREEMSEAVREEARSVLVMTSGRRREDKEIWRWDDEEVHESMKMKKLTKKCWDRQGDEESHQGWMEISTVL